MSSHDFDDRDIPEKEDSRAVLDQRIREAYEEIREALGYIERQEDGPMTMRAALREIKQRVSAIEVETWYLTGLLDRYQTITDRVIGQRDEALRQRDLLKLLAAWLGWRDPHNPPDDPSDSSPDKDGS